MKVEGKSWKYTRILKSLGNRSFYKTVLDGSGEPIDIYLHSNVEIQTISAVAEAEKISEEDCYKKYFKKIFRDTNAQSSIRTRVMDAVAGVSDFVSIDYTPRSGRNKGKNTTLYYKGANCDLIAWLSDTAYEKNGRLVKLEKAGTYWDGFPLNNLTKEGGVLFPSGKKPILLIEKILRLASNEDSLILDSFAGSGSTAHAVLKLNTQDGGNRRFILCEMMDYAESITAERVRRVMNGYGEGTKTVPGTGGAFDYYTVGSTLFKEDKNLNEEVGEAAIRNYVAYTETIPAEKQSNTDNPVSRYMLGASETALWLFYYERDRVTTLNLDFLASLNIKALIDGGGKGGVKAKRKRPENFIVYADKCALDKDFLIKHGITFKRIPRDISRF
jgi:adenine-specific DNA-methyltransferase